MLQRAEADSEKQKRRSDRSPFNLLFGGADRIRTGMVTICNRLRSLSATAPRARDIQTRPQSVQHIF